MRRGVSPILYAASREAYIAIEPSR